jgi:hypothetical protein
VRARAQCAHRGITREGGMAAVLTDDVSRHVLFGSGDQHTSATPTVPRACGRSRWRFYQGACVQVRVRKCAFSAYQPCECCGFRAECQRDASPPHLYGMGSLRAHGSRRAWRFRGDGQACACVCVRRVRVCACVTSCEGQAAGTDAKAVAVSWYDNITRTHRSCAHVRGVSEVMHRRSGATKIHQHPTDNS